MSVITSRAAPVHPDALRAATSLRQAHGHRIARAPLEAASHNYRRRAPARAAPRNTFTIEPPCRRGSWTCAARPPRALRKEPTTLRSTRAGCARRPWPPRASGARRIRRCDVGRHCAQLQSRPRRASPRPPSCETSLLHRDGAPSRAAIASTTRAARASVPQVVHAHRLCRGLAAGVAVASRMSLGPLR